MIGRRGFIGGMGMFLGASIVGETLASSHTTYSEHILLGDDRIVDLSGSKIGKYNSSKLNSPTNDGFSFSENILEDDSGNNWVGIYTAYSIEGAPIGKAFAGEQAVDDNDEVSQSLPGQYGWGFESTAWGPFSHNGKMYVEVDWDDNTSARGDPSNRMMEWDIWGQSTSDNGTPWGGTFQGDDDGNQESPPSYFQIDYNLHRFSVNGETETLLNGSTNFTIVDISGRWVILNRDDDGSNLKAIDSRDIDSFDRDEFDVDNSANTIEKFDSLVIVQNNSTTWAYDTNSLSQKWSKSWASDVYMVDGTLITDRSDGVYKIDTSTGELTQLFDESSNIRMSVALPNKLPIVVDHVVKGGSPLTNYKIGIATDDGTMQFDYGIDGHNFWDINTLYQDTFFGREDSILVTVIVDGEVKDYRNFDSHPQKALQFDLDNPNIKSLKYSETNPIQNEIRGTDNGSIVTGHRGA